MAIKISDIPPEGVTIEVAESVDLFGEGRAPASFTATLTVRPGPEGLLHVSGRVNADAELECCRCLRRFPFPVRDAAMELDLVSEGARASAAEHELGRAELDTEFYAGEEIEPRDLVREQVLLALPMAPVHREDCKGLCPVCGADRNERECGCAAAAPPERESPFAALRKIIKPEKE